MAGAYSIDDVDFVVTAPISKEGDWLSATMPRPSLHGFYCALFLSLLIHVLILILRWQPPAYIPDSGPKATRSMQLSLNYAAPSEPKSEPLPLEPAPLKPALLEPDIIPDAVAAPVSTNVVTRVDSPPNTKAEVAPERVDSETLQKMLRQQNLYPLTTVGESVFSIETPSSQVDAERTRSGLDDIFDPRLRARIQNSPAYVSNQPASKRNAFTTIHGNTIVELDSGLCMKSFSTDGGQPTDWYFAACPGRKNESEQMMERVNRDFQNRR